jgi:hypothetical protein
MPSPLDGAVIDIRRIQIESRFELTGRVVKLR